MGIIKQLYFEKIMETEFYEQLSIIQDYIMDLRSQGVLRQILGKGLDSLSKKQAYLYEKDILPIWKQKFVNCVRCSYTIFTENSYRLNDLDFICSECWDK